MRGGSSSGNNSRLTYATRAPRFNLDFGRSCRGDGGFCFSAAPRRGHQCGVAGDGGALLLCLGIPLLQQICRGARAGAGLTAGDPRRAAGKWPRFRSYQQVGGLRTPLCRHRRAGAASRPGAGRAIRVSPGDVVDFGGGGVWWLRAGFRDPAVLRAPRWQIALPDGQRRDRDYRRAGGVRCGAQHHRHPAGRGRTHRGECSEVEPLGNVHHRHDHSHRAADGRLFAAHPAREGSGNFAFRIRVSDAGGIWRPVGFASAQCRANLHAERAGAGSAADNLWLRRLGRAGLGAAGAARLSEHVRKVGDHRSVGVRHFGGASHTAYAGAEPLHRWHRAHFCRQHVPVRVYHHCLRRHQRISFADLQRHHA